nr:hypothetical protein [Tanacetum cinerariifolium]
MVGDDDDETLKDKEIDKLMPLISLSFKKIYKPTNNNLRTSSNTSRTNQDNSPRIHKNAGYEHQRLGNVVGAKEIVGSSVVQKSGIQCYNCKEYGHVSRECQKSKRAKDAAYHREKMLLCKQEEAGIQLNAEQADWKDDTDDESDDQELEAHYMYMAKLQQVLKFLWVLKWMNVKFFIEYVYALKFICDVYDSLVIMIVGFMCSFDLKLMNLCTLDALNCSCGYYDDK